MNNRINRKQFIKTTGLAGLAIGIDLSALAGSGRKVLETGWTQSPLPYAYNAIEPVIDAQTMEIHYTKHAATYAKNLAEAVQAEHVDTGKTTIESLLSKISSYSVKMRNNAGGHYNHELFWKLLRKPADNNEPKQKIAAAIVKDFNSLEAFQNEFNEAATGRFGSGWAWLILTDDKKLKIVSTPNQDNTLMDVAEVKGLPVLGLDVWEHAYYLKYQNKRADYIKAWWSALNWDFIESRFADLVK